MPLRLRSPQAGGRTRQVERKNNPHHQGIPGYVQALRRPEGAYLRQEDCL